MLTTGSYSDYSLHSIWTDRKKAEEVYKVLRDANSILEMEADVVPDDEFDNCWTFKFDPSGNIVERRVSGFEWLDPYEEDGLLVIGVEMREFNPEKALKIACDKRAEYLAKKAGI